MDRDPVRQWEDHVIVCGLRGVGLRTVEQLHQAGVEVVVVDDEPDQRLERVVEASDVPCIVGSPRIAAVLEQAGPGAARAMLCAERTEVQTLETSLLISELRPDIRVVVQMGNAAVGSAVAQVTGPGTVLDVARPGRSLHRAGLPGRRLVPDRVGGHPVRHHRGRGAAVCVVSGPVRLPRPSPSCPRTGRPRWPARAATTWSRSGIWSPCSAPRTRWPGPVSTSGPEEAVPTPGRVTRGVPVWGGA